METAGSVDGRRRRREDGRRAVVDAVIDLLLDGHTPSVEAVAGRAGVSVASVFRYFATLDDLRHEGIHRFLERIDHLLAVPAIGSGSLDDRIDRLVRARLRYYDAAAPVAREPIDVILHEQMGDELFNENLLDNVIDARHRLLAPHGRILPSRFRLFVEPMSLRSDMRVRRLHNIDLPDGIDLRPMEHAAITAAFSADRFEQFWARPGSVAATIGRPEPLVEFDLATLDAADSLPRRHLIERTATEGAVVDGVGVWFEAVFDDETTLTTSPLAPITSWGNRVFRLDREIERGETLRLSVDLGVLVDPDSWSVVVA